MSNAVVLNDYEVLNQEGLRYPDEFVRHKILDAVGDLYVSGNQIIGKYRAHASGHRINNLLLEAAFAKGAVSVVQFPNFKLRSLFEYLEPDSVHIPSVNFI
jgi:UDP-3-O-[3-hydroxymyristoyl] N-acetylglucosamine deacetylase